MDEKEKLEKIHALLKRMMIEHKLESDWDVDCFLNQIVLTWRLACVDGCQTEAAYFELCEKYNKFDTYLDSTLATYFKNNK